MSSISTNNYISSSLSSAENAASNKNLGVVEVYFAKIKDISSEYSRLKNYFDNRDKLNSDKLHFEEDRDTYLFCHTLLRLILMKKFITDTSEITIINDGKSKPRLEGDPLFFNISHTRDAFAFAISRYYEVGIDIEKVDRSIDFKSITGKFFSRAESSFILDSPDDSRNRFFLLWTRKEALLKAMGTGIISDLSHFEIFRKKNLINRKSCEKMIDGSEFFDHFIYSKKILKYYLSVAVPQKTKILLHKLNVEKVKSFYVE